jgi:tetratricopeptide (TPR) repeat protein
LYAARKKPFLFAGLIWFGLSILTALLWDVRSRFMYFPMIGLCIVFSWLVFDLYNYKSLRLYIFSGLFLFLSFLSLKSFAQISFWRNSKTFYSQCIQENPNNAEAQDGLGRVLFASGQKEDALIHFQKALSINPMLPYNLYQVYFSTKDTSQENLEFYKKATRLNPLYGQAYFAIAMKELESSQTNRATMYFTLARKTDPSISEANFQLGNIHFFQRHYNEAIQDYLRVLEASPSHVESYYKLGMICLNNRNLMDAKTYLDSALRIKPDYRPALDAIHLLKQSKGN